VKVVLFHVDGQKDRQTYRQTRRS